MELGPRPLSGEGLGWLALVHRKHGKVTLLTEQSVVAGSGWTQEGAVLPSSSLAVPSQGPYRQSLTRQLAKQAHSQSPHPSITKKS